MNARAIRLISGLLLTTSGFVAAKTLSVQEHNFAVELPPGWSTIDAPSPAVAAAKNADGQKVVIVIAARVPENERRYAARDNGGSAREATKNKGWPIIAERERVVNSLPFDTFTARIPDGTTVTTWITSAGSEVYLLQGIHKTSDADSDSELQSVLSSFHLLTPAEINTPRAVLSSITYRIGYILPPLVILGLVGTGIVWLIRRMTRKRA
jgi:predicted Zn-dependent protease